MQSSFVYLFLYRLLVSLFEYAVIHDKLLSLLCGFQFLLKEIFCRVPFITSENFMIREEFHDIRMYCKKINLVWDIDEFTRKPVPILHDLIFTIIQQIWTTIYSSSFSVIVPNDIHLFLLFGASLPQLLHIPPLFIVLLHLPQPHCLLGNPFLQVLPRRAHL